ncbi:MAG: CpcT/CpeT family chromophore lyase [Rhodospirillaceae bacterium]|nr:CpcT/CpeT family chromophore lyase [Rhodospirillaceae bacterium]
MHRLSMFVAVALSMTVPAQATTSPAELNGVLDRLMADLPGEYDNEPQRFFEAEYKTPKDQQHQRVYRAFTRIDAPDVGEHVIVATVHSGDKYAKFDFAEFQVWTLRVDGKAGVVRMSPRKFKDPEKFQPIATDAAKLNGLKANDLIEAKGAAGCDILWQRLGSQLRGVTEPGACRTTLARIQTEAEFDWEWLMAGEELWITFAGRDAAGKLVMGRPDQTHWRLGKARTFDCELAYRPAQGAAQSFAFAMHDRGDIHRLTLNDAGADRPAFVELIRGLWPSNSGRNYVDLLRMQVYLGAPEAEPDSWALIGNATGSADTDRAGFKGRRLDGLCQLRK